MQSSSRPHLFAEFLPNIRQITFYASPASRLPNTPGDELTAHTDTPSSSAPRLTLSDSRTSISVSYSDQTQTLPLPTRVSLNARHALSNPPSASGKGNQEISVRLQIDDSATTDLSDQHAVQVPWSAKDLNPNTRVRCRGCGNEIFIPKPSSEVAWKDLPSSDWAEMMDLWHCHKPDPHEDDNSDDTTAVFNGAEDGIESAKGYGAANHAVCTPGTVFVDVVSFVAAESDCRGLKKKNPVDSDALNGGDTQARSPSSLLCEECEAIIGEEHPSLKGLKLYKTNISVSKNGESSAQTFPVDMVVSAQLLVLIDRTGARRFVIHSDDEDSSGGFLIWVFNPSLRYSSSTSRPTSSATISGQRAMKVFYQHLSNTELQSLLNPKSGAPASAALEELSLPVGIYDTLQKGLQASTSILPLSAREFKEWKVGLLDLYEEEGSS